MIGQHGQELLAVCVLGCRPGSAALSRRAVTAARAFREENADIVVACGGRAWDGMVEADVLARLLRKEDVPDAAIVREGRSWDTYENAAEASAILRKLPVVLVTCSWHLPRARLLFERAGVNVVRAVGAPPPHPTLLERAYWRARERISIWKDLHR